MHFYSSRANGQYLPRSHAKMGAKATQPWSTRKRNTYIKYVVIGVLLVVLYLNWNTANEMAPYTVSIEKKGSRAGRTQTGADGGSGSSGAAAAARDGGTPKIAIVTFTTGEKSYTYMSLKNKQEYVDKQNYTLIIDYEAPESKDVGIMWHKFAMIERLVAQNAYDWIWWMDFDMLITNHKLALHDVINEVLFAAPGANDGEVEHHEAEHSEAEHHDEGAEKDDDEDDDDEEEKKKKSDKHARRSPSIFPPAKEKDWQTKFTAASAVEGVDPNEIDFLLTADCFPLNAGSMLVRGRLPPGRTTPLTSTKFLGRVREYHAANASYENQLSEQDCIRDMLFDVDPGFAKKHVHFIPQWMINSFPVEIKCWDKDQRGFERGTLAIHFAGAWAHVKEEDPTGFLMRKYEGEIVH